MAVKITYLLGAGASAGAFPLIKKTKDSKGLPLALREFIDSYKDSIINNNPDGEELWKSLREVVILSTQFGTPDLCAKFLIETGDDQKYKLLIRLLSNYFAFYQSNHPMPNKAGTMEARFDFRALGFLTTISQGKRVPPNIRLVSWNYDRQVEIAAERLKHSNRPGDKKIGGFTCWPNPTECENPGVLGSEAFLFHINGVAGFNYSEGVLSEQDTGSFDFQGLDKESLLSFAWEDEPTYGKRTFLENRLKYLEKIAQGTEILVVIGYSFPFFNRKIDSVFFNAMEGSLNKIYYQDPFLDGSQLPGQFGLSQKIASNIIRIPQVESYYIPFEL